MDDLTLGSVTDQGITPYIAELRARSEDIGHYGCCRAICVDLRVHVLYP
jgi:hypothetical protein